MQKEAFEDKIKRVAEQFDRRPPEMTWDAISEGLADQDDDQSRLLRRTWFLPTGLIAAIILVGIFARPFFEAQTSWLDNYWNALALAKQEHKPLLVFITRSCPKCDPVDRILETSNLKDLIDQFIAVRLVVDDQKAIDSVLLKQMFPGSRKIVTKIRQDQTMTVQVDSDSSRLRTYGQVWERLQDKLTPYPYDEPQQPFLAVFDPESATMTDSMYPNSDKDKDLEYSIEKWLERQLGLLRDGHLAVGYRLFLGQCGQCHARNMKDRLTGPALGGVSERWADYPEEDLYRFIRESQAMIAEGHPKALAVWNEWKPTVMLNFPEITDQEMKRLVDFIEWRYRQN